MSNVTPSDKLPLPEQPTGDPAEARLIAMVSAIMRDSQDEETLRAAVHVLAAALRALRQSRSAR